MKYALISKNEPVSTGYRIAQVETYIFPIAGDLLFWVECENYVEADSYFYDIDTLIKKIPEPEPLPQSEQEQPTGVENF